MEGEGLDGVPQEKDLFASIGAGATAAGSRADSLGITQGGLSPSNASQRPFLVCLIKPVAALRGEIVLKKTLLLAGVLGTVGEGGLEGAIPSFMKSLSRAFIDFDRAEGRASANSVIEISCRATKFSWHGASSPMKLIFMEISSGRITGWDGGGSARLVPWALFSASW